jgi:lipopolysaccharide export LptBFGC system permease protein LptF
MKTWPVLLLVVLVAAATVFTSCDWLGIGKSKAQKEYEQKVEAYQKQQEAYQKQMDEYYQNLQKSLNEYNEAYQKWQDQQLQQEIQAAEGETQVVIVTANQTQP